MRKKPWNRVDLPVYSISSTDANGNCNMNIITYASQISMHPKQFICGIYNGTKTLSNVLQHPVFVLQLLGAPQVNLVQLLGKQSGNNIDKMSRLRKRNCLVQWNGFTVLKDCLAVMEMHATELAVHEMQQPDHSIFICHVKGYKNLNEGTPLTLNTLREKKLIRL